MAYEYKIVSFNLNLAPDYQPFADELDKLSVQGWDVFQVTNLGMMQFAYLRRPVVVKYNKLPDSFDTGD